MEQETREQYTVNGYLFGDAEDVTLANQELSIIQYMDKKICKRFSKVCYNNNTHILEKNI